MKIGEYEYPADIAFKDALKVAERAITEYENKMSNKDVGEALGYKIKNPAAISGYIFRKFDEICLYNVMKRERGFMVATDIAKEALDPYDTRKAEEGKAKAIRQMPIVNKAYTEWNGEIPQETAFPSRLVDLLSIPWQEAQKHAETLRKLFIEVFPYLKTVTALESAQGAGQGYEVGGGNMGMESKEGNLTITARETGFGFTKTLPFTKKGIESLRKLIDFLETQISEEGKEKKEE